MGDRQGERSREKGIFAEPDPWIHYSFGRYPAGLRGTP